jgi:hypothetical protein
MALDTKAQVGFINHVDGLHKIDLKTGKKLSKYKMTMGREAKKSSPIILKYKNTKLIASACFTTDVCFFDYGTLNILKKFTFSDGLSGQLGVGEDFLMITLNKNTPLILLE